ncbi:MAG TPA: hypothetical protein VGP36_16365 [Mycobacteriales bacterium]|nr:hypothetical protein [Mycobacteriales bacterium]
MTLALRAESRKLFTTRVWFWLVVLTAGLSLLITGLNAGLTRIDDPANFMQDAVSGTTGLAVIISSVLGVIGVTGEYRHLTVTPTFLSVPRRGSVITAKMITYGITGLALGALAVASSVVITAVIFSARGIDVELGSDDVPRIIVGGIVASGIWGVIGVGVGALLRNQVAAVVGILLYRFVVETLIFAIAKVQQAYPYVPGGATTALSTGSGDRTNGDITLLTPWAGGIVLLAYGVAFAVLAWLFTVRRDVS